jgi:hypothetical protein
MSTSGPNAVATLIPAQRPATFDCPAWCSREHAGDTPATASHWTADAFAKDLDLSISGNTVYADLNGHPGEPVVIVLHDDQDQREWRLTLDEAADLATKLLQLSVTGRNGVEVSGVGA